MASNGRDAHEERVANILIAHHESLVTGSSSGEIESSSAELDGDTQERLKRAQRCLGVLEQVRRGLIDTAAGDFLPLDELAQNEKEEPPARIGRFRIEREIGRGGYGVVFLAFDPLLNRRVALKVPRPEVLVTAELRRRFAREARAAASLEHPNIVALYEVGEDGPICYIASAYSSGPNLAQWMRSRRERASFQLAAQLVAEVADAVEYAHTQGVLHRDIKPSNLLLQPKQEASSSDGKTSGGDSGLNPKLTDFGLAKLLDYEGEETRSGMLMGTPRYMSPEQATGQHELGPQTDVYSLGVVLYELLAGRPPFGGDSDVETIKQVVADEPMLLRYVRANFPRELEAICLKCLEKEPRRRYASAGELAADLRRFLVGKPTIASPIGHGNRLFKWTRRRPITTALLVVIVLSVAALSAGGWWHSTRLNTSLAMANRLRQEADDHRHLAVEREQTSTRMLYASRMKMAQQAWHNDNLLQCVNLLSQYDQGTELSDLRGFEWHYLDHIVHQESQTLAIPGAGHVFAVAFVPGGSNVATGGADGVIRLWNRATGELESSLKGHTSCVNSLAATKDGTLLASASCDETIKIWGLAKEEVRFTLDEHRSKVEGVRFSGDGKTFFSVGEDDVIRIWDTSQGKRLGEIERSDTTLEGVAWEPNGALIATAWGDRSLQVWNWRLGTVEARLQLDAPVSLLAFAGPNETIAAGGRNNATVLWDYKADRKPVMLETTTWTEAMAFSQDGSRLAVAGKDHVVRLWDVAQRSVVKSIKGHTGKLNDVTFSSDGTWLATASDDDSAKIWQHETDDLFDQLAFPLSGASAVALSNHGTNLAIGRVDGTVDLFDFRSRERIAILPSISERGVVTTAFSQNGEVLVVVGRTDGARLWDLNARPPRLIHSAVHGVHAVSTDRRLYLTNGPGQYELLIKSFDDEDFERSIAASDLLISSCFTADGRLLFLGTAMDGEVWDVSQAKRIGRVSRLDGWTWALTLSPDEKLLGMASGRSVRLWNTELGVDAGTLLGHTGSVFSIAFSPDSKTIATGAEDGTIRLWQAATGQEMLVLESHTAPVRSVTFSSDGRSLFSVAGDPGQATEVFQWRTSGPGQTVQNIVDVHDN